MGVLQRIAGALVIACAAFGVPLTAMATSADDYANAVQRTLTFVRFAENGDEPSVSRAVGAFAPIAPDQPEIRSDLGRTPPDLSDADARLTALLTALRQRADVADPSASQATLRQILAMPRYASLSAGPPWWERPVLWLLQQIGRLLSLLGAGPLRIPPLAFLVASALVLALIAVWLSRSMLGRVGRGAPRAPAPVGAPARVDYFALADQEAARGDYAAALRALAGGVATALGGDRAWASSPLTVREIFQRATQPHSLRPLLLAFEASWYGHRSPDADAYARAASAADPYRRMAA